ncbi:coenzyme F420-0:L-glutamate ligase [Methanolapillus millepedarum]|uniref:Bifunctional F420 biosynthesis protein FbiB n=1 Tax=Methanolapillus millepedarum TaxID=3028296 RepID=A0AA97A4C8_9EURY|nr:Bifunctional F420 biosynthesis protein FbiB [Methanosarcinaceae archaeon Ac7]
MELTFKAVDNIPLIQKGDDLADLIFKEADLYDNDIVVIASTIVSKSLGLTFYLSDIVPGKEAKRIARLNQKEPEFVQAVLDESLEVFVETPFMLVRNKNRHICINAGIDGSNVGGGRLLKLPNNPDGCATAIGEKLEKLTGKKISVIITDTNGRAFKEGQTNVAIGLYKIKALRTWIGEKDLFGYVLEISEEAVVDEIAGAANLIMGEGANGYPVVIVRGLDLYTPEKTSIMEFYRKKEDDVIVKGLLEIKKQDNRKKIKK